MTTEHSLMELVSLLKSSKKAERKLGFSNLQLMIQQESVQNFLTRSSRLKTGSINWNTLFAAMHLACEAEILSRIVQKLARELPEIIKLFVEKSNGHILASSLTDAIINVLVSPDLSPVLGTCYCELATTHLLMRPRYRAELSPDEWKGLLRVARKSYKEPPHHGINKLQILELLSKTVTFGVQHSLPSSELRKLLPLLEDIVRTSSTPSTQRDSYLMQTINSCLMALAIDDRFVVASWVENIVPGVCGMYRHGRDDVNNLIFQFFSLALRIHHPKGANEGDPVAFAWDWALWNKDLKELEQICNAELDNILRTGNESSGYFLNLLTDLTVCVKHETHENCLEEDRVDILPTSVPGTLKRKSFDSTQMTPTRKRVKIEQYLDHFPRIFEQMTSTNRLIWLKYLERMLEKYPEYVDEYYQPVATVISNLLCEVRLSPDPVELLNLSKCAVGLLNRLSTFPQKKRKELLPVWTSVRETLPRSVLKDNCEELHEVLQKLISLSAINLEDLVLSLPKTPVSGGCLRSIAELVISGAVKTDKDRCLLMNYCTREIVEPSINAELAFLLALKKPSRDPKPRVSPKMNFEDTYYVLALKGVPAFSSVQVQQPVEEALHPEPVRILMDIIQTRCDAACKEIEEIRGNEKFGEELKKLANFIEFFCRVTSYFWTKLKYSLLSQLRRLFSLFMSLVADTLSATTTPCSLLPLHILVHLLSLDLHPDLHLALREPNCTNPLIMQKIWELFKDLWSKKKNELVSVETWNYLEYPQFSAALLRVSENADCFAMLCRGSGETFTPALIAANSLGHFIASPGRINPSGSQLAGDLLDFLLTTVSQNKSFPGPLQLQLVLRLLHIMLISPLQPEQMYKCLDVMLCVAQTKYSDATLLTVILTLLYDSVPSLAENHDGECLDCFSRLMEGFRGVLQKRKGLPLVMMKAFINLLTRMCDFPVLASLTWAGSDDKMVTDILCQLNHESVSVRTEAALSCGRVFKISLDDEWTKMALNLLERDLPQQRGNGYEKIAVGGTWLTALSHAFSACQLSRLKIANLIAKTVRNQDCDMIVVENFLQTTSKLLNVADCSKYFRRHLKELLSDWLRHSEIVDFPYKLCGSSTPIEFYRDNLAIIGAVLLACRKNETLVDIAPLVNMSFQQVFEKSYPILNVFASSSLLRELELSAEQNREIQELRLDECIIAVLRESKFPSRDFLIQAFHNGSVTQKILLSLEEDLIESVTEEDTLESFRRYKSFIERYMTIVNDKETQTNIPKENDCYVLRDCLFLSLRVLSGKCSENFVVLCCELLRNVVEGFVQKYPAEITEALPGIVQTVIPFVDGGNEQSKQVIGLLKYLLIDCRPVLSGAIDRLDPLPDDPVFAGFIEPVELGLLEEMYRVTIPSVYKGRRVGGLARLLTALENKKDELLLIQRDVRAGKHRAFLCNFIISLVEHASLGDEAVRLEVAKCLGELGPIDLNVLAIRPEETENDNAVTPGSETFELRLVDTLMAILKQVIETEGFQAKRAACNALYALLQYQGAESQCSAFYHPFLPSTLTQMFFEVKTDMAPAVAFWVPGNAKEHFLWLRDLICALLDLLADGAGLTGFLRELCLVHPPTAEKLLPLVLEIVARFSSQSMKNEMSSRLNYFLQSHLDGKSGLSTKSLRCAVEALDHMRRHHSSLLPGVDNLLVAVSAGHCGAHFVSMVFAEAWFEEQKAAAYEKNPNLWRFTIDHVADRGLVLSRTARSAFEHFGLPDGVLGCGTAHLKDRSVRIAHMEQIGRWDLALQMHDDMRNDKGVMTALKQKGLVHALTQLETIDEESLLSCAMRLGDWSRIHSTESAPSFTVCHYSALKALHEKDLSGCIAAVDQATNLVLDELTDARVESSRDLYKSLARLQCLKELRDVVAVKSETEMDELCRKWSLQDDFIVSDFLVIEETLTSRCIAVKERESQHLGELYMRLARVARHSKRYDIQYRMVTNASAIKSASESLLKLAKVEEARYFWAGNEQKTAIFLLNDVLKSFKPGVDNDFHAKCLRLYADWMVESKAENRDVILKQYLSKSENFAEQEANRIETYACIAKFADVHYTQLRDYLESGEYTTRVGNVRQLQTDLVGLAGSVRTQDQIAAIKCRKKETANDQAELSSMEEERERFYLIAVRYYLMSLELGEKFNHFVFRLLSLWLNSPTKFIAPEITKRLPNIPSYKFIKLLPQIAPRMNEDDLLKDIVRRALLEHPHHTLPIIFALKNSHADYEYTKSAERPKPTQRINSAFHLLRSTASNPAMSRLISRMEIFTNAVIALANQEITGLRCGRVNILPDSPIAKIRDFTEVLVPTIDLPVAPNMSYPKIVGIHKFLDYFDLVGGINAPKKLECVGTDGVKRTLLVKGKDDPRQDAVMQQVFSVINEVLSHDETTERQKLWMRTYRVVPLSQRSGIIQWCENTQPMGFYLAGPGGSGGAHAKFRPQDIRPKEARSRMTLIEKLEPEAKLPAFLDICRDFKPVFHHFFLEKFPSVGVMFEKRLAYIRSVATSSMIGYVLGLGDRHPQNILIDNRTSEVIHIDFGIAFELGKTLPTPETIPFRLTRDVVDGMGMCGVDGVFRASCERTMAVLRSHKEVIITLLQVLLYDPLYSWTLTPQKVQAIQKQMFDSSASSSEGGEQLVNAAAERALLRLTAKLQGMEQGGVVSTVEGQVNGLLQSAQDPANLCRVFHGWQAYL